MLAKTALELYTPGKSSENTNEGVQFLQLGFSGTPTGAEAGDVSAVRETGPDLKEGLPFQGVHLLLGKDWELLIGGRINIERNAPGRKDVFKPLSHFNGVAAYFHIETACEKSLELDSQEPAFSQKGSVLLDYGEKVLRSIAGRENHGFSAEGANLGSADIEYVAEAGKFLQGNIGLRAGKAISQARAIYKELHPVIMANRLEFRQFSLGINGSVLCGERDINHIRMGHMRPGCILIESLKIGAEFPGIHLSVMGRKSYHLVTTEFHSTGFVHGNMACIGRNHSTVMRDNSINYRRIGLSAPYKEENGGLRAVDSLTDKPLGIFGERILPVARFLDKICL